MSLFEEMCMNLGVEKGSKYEIAVAALVNELIFDDNMYSDDEIVSIVSQRFKNLFPYF